MNSSEAYLELLEEIQNDLEESVEENSWDGIGDVIHKIREALDNPFDNYNTEGWRSPQAPQSRSWRRRWVRPPRATDRGRSTRRPLPS